MPDDVSTRDYDKDIKHFQNINASLLTHTINVILTLSVALIAFAVNLLTTAKEPLDHYAGWWLSGGIVVLLVATFTGIYLLYNRIRDYAKTIETISLVQKSPPAITEEQKVTFDALRKRAKRINSITRLLLFWVQPSLFLLGFCCITASVFITHGETLNLFGGVGAVQGKPVQTPVPPTALHPVK
jgi:hypothetical protein